MSKVTELTLSDTHDPEYSTVDLWIGQTATNKCAIEIAVSGLLYMQQESLGCTLTKDDALLLANTILNHFKD